MDDNKDMTNPDLSWCSYCAQCVVMVILGFGFPLGHDLQYSGYVFHSTFQPDSVLVHHCSPDLEECIGHSCHFFPGEAQEEDRLCVAHFVVHGVAEGPAADLGVFLECFMEI